MHTYIYFILDRICIYNNIVFTLPEITKNISIFQDNIYIEYLKINNIDFFIILNKYTEIFKEIDLSKININLAIYNLFDFNQHKLIVFFYLNFFILLKKICHYFCL